MTDLNPQAKQMADESIFELNFPDGTFDLTVCRHVLHSIPHPNHVLAELRRAIAYFDAMIGNVRDPNGYAVWMVPVVAARVPR